MNESILYNICMLVSTMVEVYLVFDFYKAFYAKTEIFSYLFLMFFCWYGISTGKCCVTYISWNYHNCSFYECRDDFLFFAKCFG